MPETAYEIPPGGKVRGQVIAVGGSHAVVSLNADGAASLTVGGLLEIQVAHSDVVAVVTNVEGTHQQGDRVAADVDLLGEIVPDDKGGRRFQRGVSEYPRIGADAGVLDRDDLTLIYDVSGPKTINVGNLSQDPEVGAFIDVDEMLQKHFAVLGTTGVGKSSGVAVILGEILRARPKQRIFLIDPHNEYGACFGDKAQTLTPANLRLPFWLFSFEEMVDVIFRARPGVEEEVEILSQAIAEAKNRFAEERDNLRPRLRKVESSGPGYTVDTPVPYRLADVLSVIDDRMGKLENRAAFAKYHRLITRIDMVNNDPRYRFMFHNANVGGDTMVDVLSELFNLPDHTGPMTVMQLAGFPSEVVDSVVSVLCRMAFELGLWSGGAIPLLMVCEEAHRYAPSDKSIGFGPTKKAISRIAKEGRKYSVFLGLITQRPAELDATIVSQCSTLFAMRMANDRDQDIVRSAVSDAAASLLAFVPSLGTREVFAFGEGVALPTRLRFKKLPPEALPRSNTGAESYDPDRAIDNRLIANVIERWRRASMSHARTSHDAEEDFEMDLDAAITKADRDAAEADRIGDAPIRSREPMRTEHVEPARADEPLEAGPLIGQLRRQSHL